MSCIEERSLSTAKDELEELEEFEALEELDAPVAADRPEEEALPPDAEVPDPDDPDELLLLDALVVPLADTTSPTCPESETIVPSPGA
jgi:hypothetical protein